jgi:mannose-6-phosphate isomerase-like protein (cupin superfamily)
VGLPGDRTRDQVNTGELCDWSIRAQLGSRPRPRIVCNDLRWSDYDQWRNRRIVTSERLTVMSSSIFDITAIARAFPDSAVTMLVDTRLTDEPEASSRVFRVYTNVPPHYHATCDEYLFVLSGRALFTVGDAPPVEVNPGQLIFFKRNVIHAIAPAGGEPVVFLSVDTPRRDPSDVIFVNPSDGTPDTFIETRQLY